MSDQKSCSFCNENFPSWDALSEHLFLCGNKTDQCPNCRQFIRRAVFAFHYENDCADLDENTGTVRPKLSSSDDKQTSSQKTTGMLKCEYCQQNVLPDDYERHKGMCPKHPKNSANFNQNQSFNPQQHTDGDIVKIPCQFCYQPIELSNIDKHQKICMQQRTTPAPQNQYVNLNVNEQIKCGYCGAKYCDSQYLRFHLNTCAKYPGSKSYAAAVIRGHQHPS